MFLKNFLRYVTLSSPKEASLPHVSFRGISKPHLRAQFSPSPSLLGLHRIMILLLYSGIDSIVIYISGGMFCRAGCLVSGGSGGLCVLGRIRGWGM